MAKTPSCRRKKRLSTFKCGRRRSKSLGGMLTTDIYETVSNHLLPEDRLQAVMKLAFQHTLYAVGKQFLVEENLCLEDLLTEGSVAYEEIDQILMKKNLYKLAVASPDECEDECSEIKKYNDCIEKLEKESKLWDHILSSEREELQKNLEVTPIQQDVNNLNRNKYSYSEVLDTVNSVHKNISLEIDALTQTSSSLAYCMKMSEKYVDNLHSKTKGYFNNVLETPHTLVKKVALAKKK